MFQAVVFVVEPDFHSLRKAELEHCALSEWAVRKMLIKNVSLRQVPRIPRIAIQIGYHLSFFPQVISVFYLNFSTVLRRTTQMGHQPPLVCLRHQCILPSVFAFAQKDLCLWINVYV